MPSVTLCMKNDFYDKFICFAKKNGANMSRVVRHDDRTSQRLCVNIEKDVYENVKYWAKRKGMSMSGYICDVLKNSMRDKMPKECLENPRAAIMDENF